VVAVARKTGTGTGADVGAPAPAPDHARAAVTRFNALPEEETAEALSACCASRRWVAAVAAGRPYSDTRALHRAATAALAGLDWSDVLEALAAHPRLGQRPAGPARDAAWSRAEQAAAGGGDPLTARLLAETNAAYEAAFGHVFLLRATGRTAADALAAARARLRNDPATEQTVVRDELSQITRLRLDKLLLGMAEGITS
jgi:2-oxo-4-hydroxy-4-carboxy-5-ureidoimidazoline decarboxylase